MTGKGIVRTLVTIGALTLGSATVPVMAQTQGTIDQTQQTSSYKVVLHIGPPETVLMPDQAATATEGEVMVQIPGMPMPSMSMTDQGRPVNHHLEAHLYDRASGAVLDSVMPDIAITNQATSASRKLDPVMAMYGLAEGKSDFHYGGNVYLPDGTYTVAVTVNGETATFMDVAVSAAPPAQMPPSMAMPGQAFNPCVNPTGSGGCFSSIQAAIDAAAAGATISVAPGTYTASGTKQVALIQKGLTLQGADPATTVIDASGLNHGIVVEKADGVTISGFTVQNAWLEGVLLDQASHATVAHNVIRKNDSNPAFVPGPPQQAKCPGALPFDQDDCGEGLHLLGASFSTIDSNTVEDNIGGILLTDETGPTHDNLIAGNTVRNNSRDCGITLASHPAGFGPKGPLPGNGVYHNTMKGNTSDTNGSSGVGIFAPTPGTASYDNIVTGNTLRDNGLPGVALHSHAPGQNLNDNVIANNVISGNGADDDANAPPSGILIFSDAASHAAPITGTVISGNTVTKEALPLYLSLNPGTTTTGTLANDTGGAVENYSIIGDGSAYTFTVTFSGIDPGSRMAGIIVYGPSGEIGQAGLTAGAASFVLPTDKGVTYDVQVNNYQPHSQAGYTLRVAAAS